MTDSLVRKLEMLSPLSEDDKLFITAATRRSDLVSSDTDIIREGDEPTDVRLIDTGLAFRYKHVGRGRRQIVGLLFPGDICDLHASLLDRTDHSIATVSTSRVVRIRKGDVNALLERLGTARALLMVRLVNESIDRDWLANIGGRRAEQRLAHLFCEWHARLRMIGLAGEDGCEFALTQTNIGDVLGVTSVHVNRSLHSLRANNLIELQGKKLTLVNLEHLKKFCGFRPQYLHIQNMH